MAKVEELGGAVNAGLALLGGVVVDDRCRAGAPDVVAVGRRLPHR
ncbi:hypothetical protein [Streptomyces sp. SA15]|nr:hypothetical protein [Streptomyces sp. SA15]